MGYARYVGRVGALAVALGIGVAVSNSPAVAWAEESSASGSSADSSSNTGTSSDPGTTSKTGTTSYGADSAPDGSDAGSAENAGADADEDEDIPDEDDSDEDAAEEDGAHGEDDGTDVVDGDTEAGAQDDTDTVEPEDASGSSAQVPDTKAGRRDHTPYEEPAAAQPVSAVSTADPTPSVDSPRAEDTVSATSHPQPTSDNEATTTVTASAVTAAVSAAAAPAANPVHSFVTSVLSWFGITPQATTTPAAPVESPAAWAILAWLRREFTYTLFNRSPVLDPVQTGQSPTGAITGLLNGKDFQGAPLTYTGSGTTSHGSVTVDATTGAFTYTPDAELAAVGGTDTFVVSASNTAAYRLPGLLGVVQGGIHWGAQLLGLAQSDSTSTVVEVTVAVNGLTVISEIRTVGTASATPVLSADGTRAYHTTRLYNASTGEWTTRLTVINTVTGAVVGTPVVLDGEPGDLLVTKDGTRVSQTSEAYDEDTDTYTTTAVVLDAATGAQVGSSITLDGHRAGVLQLSGDSSRAFQTFQNFDETTRTWTTSVAVIDTATGTLVNTPVAISGSFRVHANDLLHRRALVFSADGSRAYLATQNLGSGVDATQPEKTTFAVIDTATGTLVGTPTTMDGLAVGAVTLSKDGSRVFVVTRVDIYFTNTATTRVAVLDAATGALMGDPLVLNGYPIESDEDPDTAPLLIFSPDGSRAFLSTTVWDPSTFGETTRVTIINAADGTLIGTPTVLEGRGRGPLRQSASDPTRFYQITATDFGTSTNPATSQLATISAVDGSVIGTAEVRGLNDLRYPIQFSPDGTRAYLLTIHSRGAQGGEIAPAERENVYVLTIDTATGAAVGAPLEFHMTRTVSGAAGAVQFNQDGTRAYQLVRQQLPSSTTWVTRMLVINTADGSLVRTVDLAGTAVGAMQISTDGSRVYQTTSTKLTVINGVSGEVISETTLDGAPVAGLKFDGTVGHPGYLTLTKTVTDSATAQSHTETIVTVVNTTDGRIADTWTPLNGQALNGSSVVAGPDGSRFYVVTSVHDTDTDSYSTVVAAYSVEHGTLIGAPVTLNGPQKGAPILSADGTRVVLPFSTKDPETGEWSSTLAVLDTHGPASV